MQEEEDGLRRVLSMLPNDKVTEYMALWKEFEAGETPDSRYAKSIDRVPPLLHNLYGGGHGWKKHGIAKEQVLKLNQRIELGSKSLWAVLKAKLDKFSDFGA